MFQQNDKTSKTKMELSKDYVPSITIKLNVLLKMKALVEKSSDEIGWMLSVIKRENDYYINELYMLKQKVHATTCEIDPQAMQELALELLQKSEKNFNSLRGWGHSHVNMECNPSSQDDATFKEYMGECNYFVRIIANKKGKLRIDLAEKESGYIYYNLPFNTEMEGEIEELNKYSQKLKAEYEEVKKKINAKITEIYSAISDSSEIEIKNLVSKLSSSSNWQKNNYSYNFENYDEYYDEYYNEYYGHNIEKLKKKYPTEKTKAEKLFDELSKGEKIEIMYAKNNKQIRKIFKGNERFKNLSNSDLNELFNLCTIELKNYYNI